MARRKKELETAAPPPYRVFLSHATADKWIARVLCEKLEAVGAVTFRDDRDIGGGDDIPERLREEIKRSQELVVLLTPRSVTRPWVLLEVGGAWLAGLRIVALRYHVEVDHPSDAPVEEIDRPE